MAIKKSIELFTKTDVTLEFTIDESIAGWTLALVISDQVADATPLLTQAATIVDGPAGRADVALTAAQTGGLAPGVYFYEMARTNAGAADVFTYGALTVLPRVAA